MSPGIESKGGVAPAGLIRALAAPHLRRSGPATAAPRTPVPRTASLRTVIGLAFALILLASGGALVWLDQRATLHLLQDQIDGQFDVLVKGAATQIEDQFDSADAALNTLALSPPSGDPDRVGAVLARVLGSVAVSSPAVLSIVTADAAGRYVMVQRSLHGAVRANKPPRPVYDVRIGEPGEGGSVERVIGLGADFGEVSRSAPAPVDFDARRRPWYTLAVDAPAAVTTPPYLFRGGTGRYGFSISRRIEGNPGRVFSLDVRLDSLSLNLKRGLVFPGQHVAVFSPDGSILGDSAGRPADRAAIARGLRGAAEPGSPDLDLDRALYGAYRTDPSAHDQAVTVGGRTVYANIAPVTVNGTSLVIASSVPADVFDGPANRLLLWSLGVQAAVMAAGFVLVDLAARSIARPIGLLAADVEAIIQFRFSARSPPASRIREIRRLLGAVDTLDLTLRAFSTYLPERFVRAIVDRGEAPALGGQRRPVVVMFSDVQGFSGIAETMSPDELIPQLSRYFAEISAEVLASGGILDKFIGDSVMAFWPLDASDPGCAARACSAVLAACRRVDALNAVFAAEGRPAFHTRFGLHSGDAMVGSVGTAERMNYTALGHTVNVASRIEQLNKRYSTRVLVSAALRDVAGPGFRFRHIDDAEVRGTQDRVDVYELTAAEAA